MTSRQLLQALAGPAGSNVCQGAGNGRHWHWGIVAVVSGNSVDVNLDGSPVPTTGLPHSGLYSPSPGDYVAVDHENDTWLVTHPIAT